MTIQPAGAARWLNTNLEQETNPDTAATWEATLKANAPMPTVPIEDFLELYDAAHAVIDKIRMHVDHAEYEGSMNAVNDFREIATTLRWKHADKTPDPLDEI